MDAILHRERTEAGRQSAAAALPDGVMVAHAGAAWLKRGETLRRWAPGGYAPTQRLPAVPVEVLTPPSIVGAIGAGYTPHMGA